MTDEEYLQHYGIPGMRWGHRKLVRAGGDNTRAAQQFAKKHTSIDIKKARVRVGKENIKLQEQRIKYDQAKQYAKKSEKGKAAAKRELAKYKAMRKEALHNPDRATMLRLTKGEKAFVALSSVLAPPSGALGVGLLVVSRKMAESKAVRGELKAKGKL